jgi:hypothetical protein
MQLTIRSWVAAVWLAVATSVMPASGASPPTEEGGPVAYVERIVPPDGRLADIARIKRRGQEIGISDNSMPLMAGDQIFMKRRDAALAVRMLATNKLLIVRQVTTTLGSEAADLTIPSSLPGLKGSTLAWFIGVLRGADQAGSGSAVSGSRAINSGTCYNDSRKTNEPIPFQIPILTASVSFLSAGARILFVSWEGGAQPFSVTLSTAETGGIIAQKVDVHNACAVYLPRANLTPGQIRLTVTDVNGVKEQEDNLLVVGEAPMLPRELREANLSEESRQLYAATWLTLLEGGKWAFEAQQRVAAMDCQSPAVQDWLRQWGGLAPCGR